MYKYQLLIILASYYENNNFSLQVNMSCSTKMPLLIKYGVHFKCIKIMSLIVWLHIVGCPQLFDHHLNRSTSLMCLLTSKGASVPDGGSIGVAAAGLSSFFNLSCSISPFLWSSNFSSFRFASHSLSCSQSLSCKHFSSTTPERTTGGFRLFYLILRLWH